jgi:hypothetical protein
MQIKFVSTTIIIILVLTLNTGLFAQGKGGPRIANRVSRSATGLSLFSFFRENGKDGLYLAYSYDGLSWKPLNKDKPLLKPQVGQERLMRDPCLYQAPDGVFHLVWTTGWRERGIGYANSVDLINWSEQQYLPVMADEPTAQNCWAPEIIYDYGKKEYLIFWSTTIPGKHPETDNQSSQGPPAPGLNNRIYYVTTKDFKTFSKARVLYDRGFNVIDACMVKDGGRYVMFLKDETNKPFKAQKNIRLAMARRAQGPFGPASAPITGDYWAEGPTAIKIRDTWFVYFDVYREGRYGLVVSKDLKKWEDISHQLSFPKGARHGTVLQATEEVLRKLLALN